MKTSVARPWPLRLLRLPLLLLLWLALLDFPVTVGSTGLDESWMQCLAYFLKNHYQAGVDYVCTYGPLGHFVNTAYDADLFAWKYAWELSVKLALAWLLLRASGRVRPGLPRAAYWFLVFALLPASIDTLFLFGITLVGLLPIVEDDCPAWALLAGGTLLAVLALTKFTFLILGAGAWLVLAAAFWNRPRHLLAILLSFPGSLVLVWWLAAQAPANLPRFLGASLQVAWGYGEAMATEGYRGHIYLALAVFGLLAALPATYPRSVLLRYRSLLGLALVLLGVFLVWKHGFTRQGSHFVFFFTYLAFVPFALAAIPGARTPPSRLRVALGAALVLCALDGRMTTRPDPLAWGERLLDNARSVGAPNRLRQEWDARRRELAQRWALPAIDARVGREPIDLFSCAQGVLLLNGLNYRPRPVFQSYSVYTPALIEMNAAFYRGDRAPRYVLLQLDPIDERVPMLEDGPALLEVFRRYRPVTWEKDFLLLERRPDGDTAAPANRPVLRERSVAMGERVDVSDLPRSGLVLEVHAAYTPWGKLVKFLYKPPLLFLRLETDDGRTHVFRLVPAMASCGLLLDPLVRDDADVEKLLRGGALPHVRSFSVVTDSGGDGGRFEKGVRVVVRRLGER